MFEQGCVRSGAPEPRIENPFGKAEVFIMNNDTAVLISGYAKLPENTAAEAMYENVVIAVVFDNRTGIIVEAEATMATELSKKFVSSLLAGYNLNDGIEPLITVFEEHYLGKVRRALESALRSVFSEYQEYCKRKNI